MNTQHSKLETRNSLIQRIHVLKRDLGLSDDTYRTILESISGKTSCKDIDLEYLNLVKQALEGQLQKLGSSTRTKNAKEHRKIAKLGFLLGWSWFDIAHFVQRETQGRRISTRSCTGEELSKVINGMVALINDGIATGKITLEHKDLQDFLRYTQSHKQEVL